MGRQEIAAVEVRAVGSYCVDLILGVMRSYVPGWCEAVARQPDTHHVARPLGPFALHSLESTSDVQDEVISSMLEKGTEYLDPKARRMERDRGLSHVAFAISIERFNSEAIIRALSRTHVPIVETRSDSPRRPLPGAQIDAQSYHAAEPNRRSILVTTAGMTRSAS